MASAGWCTEAAVTTAAASSPLDDDPLRGLYACEPRSAVEADATLGAPVHRYLVAVAAVTAGSVLQAARVSALYVAPLEPTLHTVTLVGLGCASVAGIAAARAVPSSRAVLGAACLGTGVAVAALGFGAFVSFAHGAWQLVASPALGAIVVAFASGAFARAVIELGPIAARLGLLEWLLGPFRLLGLVACALAGASLVARLELLRTCLALGIAASLTAALHPSRLWFLERRHRRGARPLRVISTGFALAGAAGFYAAEAMIPSSAVATFPTPIVYSRVTDRSHTVVCASQSGLELFVDNQLAVSSVDQHRYYESLVHPVMAVVPNAERALVLGAGAGMAVRELLRHPAVGRIDLVVEDATLGALVERSLWLSRLSEGALQSPRVHTVEAEALTFLSELSAPYPLIVAQLPLPTSYVAGKYFTRFFFNALARSLAPGGAAVVSMVPVTAAPSTHARLVATVQSVGLHAIPYRVPVTTLGDVMFLILTHDAVPAPTRALEGRFLTHDTLAGMLASGATLPPDTATLTPDTLDEQASVVSFLTETGALAAQDDEP